MAAAPPPVPEVDVSNQHSISTHSTHTPHERWGCTLVARRSRTYARWGIQHIKRPTSGTPPAAHQSVPGSNPRAVGVSGPRKRIGISIQSTAATQTTANRSVNAVDDVQRSFLVFLYILYSPVRVFCTLEGGENWGTKHTFPILHTFPFPMQAERMRVGGAVSRGTCPCLLSALRCRACSRHSR